MNRIFVIGEPNIIIISKQTALVIKPRPQNDLPSKWHNIQLKSRYKVL